MARPGSILQSNVLILVLVEDGLRVGENCWSMNVLQYVLILVVMEDGLRVLG